MADTIPLLVREAGIQIGTAQSNSGIALGERVRLPPDGARISRLLWSGGDGAPHSLLVAETLGQLATASARVATPAAMSDPTANAVLALRWLACLLR